jgi:hypothetical protein
MSYLSDSWSVNAWETLFLHLNATFESESKDAEVAWMVTCCENELPTGRTQIKK